MAFKIKDLMINLASTDIAGGGKPPFVTPACIGRCNTHQSGLFVTFPTLTAQIGCRCTHPTGLWYIIPCGDVEIIDVEGPDVIVEMLTTLKKELTVAVERVDREIKGVESNLGPATVEEAEALEAKLKEALDELGKLKSGLKK